MARTAGFVLSFPAMSTRRDSPRRGQALVELTIAMLVIVVIVTGIAEFVRLAGAKGETIAEARAEAGRKAISHGLSITRNPDFIRDWEEGADELRHTADDKRLPDSPSRLRTFTDPTVARASDWAYLQDCRNDGMVRMGSGPFPAGALSMSYAEESRTVELSPAMRDWVVGKESIRVATEVWMPRLELDGFDD